MKSPGMIINNKYRLGEKLYEDEMTHAYAGNDISENKKVKIKILKQEVISNRTEDIIRFHNDITAVIQFNHPHIEKIYDIVKQDNLHFIVSKLNHMKSLYELFASGYFFPEKEIIKIILQTAQALEYAHQRGVLHRSISLKSVYTSINMGKKTKSFNTQLSDFAFSGIREIDKISDPIEIENTFCYMSPEECGVIKRNIDESSDLYSLGILFYYLLSGSLPYKGKTIGSIIHQQIAKLPDPPSSVNNTIQPVLDRIILKLIEKEQNKRYRSARGLINDLKRYSEGDNDFYPGLHDKVKRLNFRSKFINREEELNELKNIITQSIHKDTHTPSGHICMIKGISGTGKTRLIEEFRHYVYSLYIPFISSKCSYNANKNPYGPVKEVLAHYLSFFQSYSHEKKSKIRNKIQEHIGDLGQILIELIPEYKNIIGNCPQLVSLDKEREHKRFLTTLSGFFSSLAEVEGGLVLCIEDLQWTDEGTLDFLYELINNIKNSPLLVIGTYRDNEVPKDHTLSFLEDEVKNKKCGFFEIKLTHFDLKRMNEFVSALLYNRITDTKEISRFILTKSAGNPFFAIQVLKNLVRQEIIYYQNNLWKIDELKLKKIEIPKAVIPILLNRISLLHKEEIEILTYAAIIGNVFTFKVLFELCTYNKSLIVSIIDKAVGLNLLEYDVYRKQMIMFAHDRIQEAFYKRVSETKKMEFHTKVACTLENMNQDISDNILFELAHHYIEGGVKDKILQYAFPAGIKAKKSYAHHDALKYFKKVVEILGEKQTQKTGLWMDSMQNIAEIYITTGKSGEGIRVINQLLLHCKDREKKALMYYQVARGFYKKGNYRKSEEYGRMGLALLGESVPIHKNSILISIVKEMIIHFIHNLLRFIYIREKKEVKSIYKIIIDIYFILGWSYVLTDSLKFVRSVFRLLNLSESKIGKSYELARSMKAYGGVLMSIPLFKRSFKYYYRTLEIIKEMPDLFEKAELYQFMAFCYSWSGNFKKSNHYHKESMKLFKRIGDIKDYGVSLTGTVENYHYLSLYKKAKKNIEEYQKIATDINDSYAKANAYGNMSLITMETGDLDKAFELAQKGYHVAKTNKVDLIECLNLVYLGMIYIEKNESTKAREHLETAKKLFEEKNLLRNYCIFIYSYLAEAYISDYLKIKDKPEKKKILLHIKKISKTACRKAKPWPTHYGGALRARAKYYALVGKHKKADKYFTLSISHCNKYLRKYDEGKSYFEFGKYLALRHQEKKARKKFEAAFKIFSNIDAQLYRERTAKILGIDKQGNEYTAKTRLMEKQRYSTIINVSRDIGSIYNLDELIGKILAKAIEITGAHRGCLFIKDLKTGELTVQSTNNLNESEITNSIKELAFYVYNTGQSRVYEENTNITFDEPINKKSFGSIICVPLQSKNKAVGVCYLDNLLIKGVFSLEDVQILEVIMTHAAISIENTALNLNIKEYAKKITENEKQLFQATRLSTLGTSISEILHEINNFNAMIKNNTYVLKMQFQYLIPILDEYYNIHGDYKIGDKYYSELKNLYPQFYQSILKNSEKIQHLVKLMKNFSKKDHMGTENVDIHKVIMDALVICRLKAKKRNVEIRYAETDNLPHLFGHKQYLVQVIINIINNSIEAADKKNSFVAINTRFEIGLSRIIITIEDNGKGIDPGDISRLSEPFYTTKKKIGGTGLGLTLVFKIIRSHSGRISFNSEKDKGTAVTITFPV